MFLGVIEYKRAMNEQQQKRQQPIPKDFFLAKKRMKCFTTACSPRDIISFATLDRKAQVWEVDGPISNASDCLGYTLKS
jgi:hypothetical protein